MSKLTAQGADQTKQFNPKTYKGKRRRKTRRFYNQNYDQRNHQSRYRPNSGDRRISFSGRIQYGQIIEITLGIIRAIEMILGEEILEGI